MTRLEAKAPLRLCAGGRRGKKREGRRNGHPQVQSQKRQAERATQMAESKTRGKHCGRSNFRRGRGIGDGPIYILQRCSKVKERKGLSIKEDGLETS